MRWGKVIMIGLLCLAGVGTGICVVHNRQRNCRRRNLRT